MSFSYCLQGEKKILTYIPPNTPKFDSIELYWGIVKNKISKLPTLNNDT